MVERICIDCGIAHSKPQSRRCARCVYLRKKATVDRWRAENADQVRLLSRQSRYRRYGPARDAAIAKLGGQCARCGFDDERALDVDHMAGGGTAERTVRDRITFYKQVVAGQRDDVQLLCLNCHRVKTLEERH